jgi:hypothetical protein
MNASMALNAARAAGVRISIDAGDLVLEATAPPPQDVLDLLRRHKTSIVTLLGVGHDGWTAEDWQVLQAERAAHFEFDCGLPRASAEARAFEGCLIEWLNRHPAPSREGRCAWCGRSETQQAVVLPYGTEPGTHTWLHSECWSSWHEARRVQAREALNQLGVGPPEPLAALPGAPQ